MKNYLSFQALFCTCSSSSWSNPKLHMQFQWLHMQPHFFFSGRGPLLHMKNWLFPPARVGTNATRSVLEGILKKQKKCMTNKQFIKLMWQQAITSEDIIWRSGSGICWWSYINYESWFRNQRRKFYQMYCYLHTSIDLVRDYLPQIKRSDHEQSKALAWTNDKDWTGKRKSKDC